MLKLSDPFEMNDVFAGIFYNAESEASANAGKALKNPNAQNSFIDALVLCGESCCVRLRECAKQ